jgi:cephalosporin hydroxylase
VDRNGARAEYAIGSPEGFREVAKAYLRAGWDAKYVYSFTWLGRPIIQLPDDMVRLQEVIYRVQPDVVIEIGVAHGGSLIFIASLCHAMGKGRVIGVDIEIRPHNRAAIESHALSGYVTLIEGDSIANETVARVSNELAGAKTTLILLDGCHTKQHVLVELRAYSKFVSEGSYIVAMDGIMRDLAGAPRSEPDWDVNNPSAAALEFVAEAPEFVLEEPGLPFNEGYITERTPTYWPNAFIRRRVTSERS